MRSKASSFLACFGLAAGLFLPGALAHADENAPYALLNFSSQPNAGPDWIITLGAGVQYGPSFEGSSKTSVSVLPSDLDIRRAGEPASWGAPDDAFSFTLFEANGFSIGPAADLRSGRSRSDERRLAGIRSVPATVDAGLFLEYWLIANRLRTHIELRQAVRSKQGLVADLAADWVQPYDAFTFSIGPRLSLANGTYMRTSFSVTQADALQNTLVTPYHASAGIKSVGALASVSYQFSPAWKATLYTKYERLTGDAADSPITRRIGSPDQNIVGLNLSYSFGVKFR
ncbi:MipA/OmpV family protein [Labrys neptuniae]